MKLQIAVLPGDGIGPEVTAEAVKVLKQVGASFGHRLEICSYAIGGKAIAAVGKSLPDETLSACLASQAILLGAVGDPVHDHLPLAQRPERALLELRRVLGNFANLRPVQAGPKPARSPFRYEAVEGVEVLIVRELAGGLYYGEPRGRRERGSEIFAWNTMAYSSSEVERVARVAFQAARGRRRKLTSVDKANVLETSMMWREVVSRVGQDYPDVSLEHLHVDRVALELVTSPRRFDVILTENLFGDILSDEAGALAGSIGLLPSASLGGRVPLYEPVHGSAPDIAGRGIANPIGAIASAAMMLRFSFGLEEEARAIERSIERALEQGYVTADLARPGRARSTEEVGDFVAGAIGCGELDPQYLWGV